MFIFLSNNFNIFKQVLNKPKTLSDNLGGRIHDTGDISCLDSPQSLAKPANLPLSLTEKITITFRDSRNAKFKIASFCGNVDQTPFDFDNTMFSVLFDFIKKNRASRNK